MFKLDIVIGDTTVLLTTIGDITTGTDTTIGVGINMATTTIILGLITTVMGMDTITIGMIPGEDQITDIVIHGVGVMEMAGEVKRLTTVLEQQVQVIMAEQPSSNPC